MVLEAGAYPDARTRLVAVAIPGPDEHRFGGVGFRLNPGCDDGFSIDDNDRVSGGFGDGMHPLFAAIATPLAEHRRLTPVARLLVPRNRECVAEPLEARFVGEIQGLGQSTLGAGRMTALVEQSKVDLGVAVAGVIPCDRESTPVGDKRRLVRDRGS